MPVGFVGPEVRVAVVVAGCLGFLREGDHVRRLGQAPVFVGPEFACGADAGLDLVDDEEGAGSLCDFAQAFEKGGGGVVVAAFGLDGLDDDGADGVVEGSD